jgi:hypothetical protein
MRLWGKESRSVITKHNIPPPFQPYVKRQSRGTSAMRKQNGDEIRFMTVKANRRLQAQALREERLFHD